MLQTPATSRIPEPTAPGGSRLPGARAAPRLDSGHADRGNSPLPPGGGRLAFERVAGASALVACAARTPLQILATRPRGLAAWATLASHGGGLVAGDRIELDVTVGEGAAALLATQAETKVYRSGGATSAQTLRATVGRAGALALLPDPVSCFEGSRYAQAQRIDLAAGGSVLLLDAVVAGRVARGERWALASYRSENRIVSEGRLVAWDALRLAPLAGASLDARLQGFEALALLVAVGPAFAEGAALLAARIAGASADGRAPVLAAASRLPSGAIAVRAAARTAGELDRWLRAALSFAAPVLGGDPLSRRW